MSFKAQIKVYVKPGAPALLKARPVAPARRQPLGETRRFEPDILPDIAGPGTPFFAEKIAENPCETRCIAPGVKLGQTGHKTGEVAA